MNACKKTKNKTHTQKVTSHQVLDSFQRLGTTRREEQFSRGQRTKSRIDLSPVSGSCSPEVGKWWVEMSSWDDGDNIGWLVWGRAGRLGSPFHCSKTGVPKLFRTGEILRRDSRYHCKMPAEGGTAWTKIITGRGGPGTKPDVTDPYRHTHAPT